jgi:hypothetical protein
MYYESLGVVFIITLFVANLFIMYIGRRIADWHEQKYPGTQKADTHITEAAIFALLGLLIALSFSSAATKFDVRRFLIVDEVNASKTAYLRLDLLPQSERKALQNNFRQYIDTRLAIYDDIAQHKDYNDHLNQSFSLQKQIWESSNQACQQTNTPTACFLLLPALNGMFDIGNTRIGNLTFHPHIFLFLILIGLVLFSSILVGYGISTKQRGGALHYLCYAFVVAVTLYAILDMEYPRIGIFRVERFDHILTDLKAQF